MRHSDCPQQFADSLNFNFLIVAIGALIGGSYFNIPYESCVLRIHMKCPNMIHLIQPITSTTK
jgi:hypothetical protein